MREKAVVLRAPSAALVDNEAPGNEVVLTFCGGDRFGRTYFLSSISGYLFPSLPFPHLIEL